MELFTQLFGKSARLLETSSGTVVGGFGPLHVRWLDRGAKATSQPRQFAATIAVRVGD